jgi:hypothetical protein
VSDRRLFSRLRENVTLTAVRTCVLLVAASFSITGYVYSYVKAASVPTEGELLTVVRGRADTPLSDARIEVLTPAEAPVSSFSAAAPPGGPRILKEGTYRLRVSHPRYAPETRLVQVIAGHTSEVRFKLTPRVAVAPPRAPAPPPDPSPVNEATRAVSESVESIKKMFTR